MNELIVDRIVQDVAVCELGDGSLVHIPLEQLPPEVQEGDCLMDMDGVYIIDEEETARRREYAQSLLKRLTQPKPSES